MATLRSGLYGSYYGSLYSESSSLTMNQMKVNAKYIAKYLKAKGWTINAISGLLGNMQAESSINPGRWQSEDVGNTSLGYGLVQWTPASKYLNWCSSEGYSDPSEMDNNLSRIMYEIQNNIQWIATDTYNFSFETFSKSTNSVEYLASAFLKCYERAGIEVEETRQANAREWYNYLNNSDLGDEEIINPPLPSVVRNKRKYNFLLFGRRKV